jgi:hypothetical protein
MALGTSLGLLFLKDRMNFPAHDHFLQPHEMGPNFIICDILKHPIPCRRTPNNDLKDDFLNFSKYNPEILPSQVTISHHHVIFTK